MIWLLTVLEALFRELLKSFQIYLHYSNLFVEMDIFDSAGYNCYWPIEWPGYDRPSQMHAFYKRFHTWAWQIPGKVMYSLKKTNISFILFTCNNSHRWKVFLLTVPYWLSNILKLRCYLLMRDSLLVFAVEGACGGCSWREIWSRGCQYECAMDICKFNEDSLVEWRKYSHPVTYWICTWDSSGPIIWRPSLWSRSHRGSFAFYNNYRTSLELRSSPYQDGWKFGLSYGCRCYRCVIFCLFSFFFFFSQHCFTIYNAHNLIFFICGVQIKRQCHLALW